ncbi:hypothetical protein DMA11_10240 [Marinilabiliaceae bacterium JC017]|nr:hypothetical protein DMA11_10240 [Marinilabiliaceae bacterium JC017]
MQKQTKKRYSLGEMEPGDRFFFTSDSKKNVWQVTSQTSDYKTIERPGKKHNYSKLNKNVVFLRKI